MYLPGDGGLDESEFELSIPAEVTQAEILRIPETSARRQPKILSASLISGGHHRLRDFILPNCSSDPLSSNSQPL
ncbi:hypothetical protein O181_008729 [Austropuccinia psidii MF-1]|uniref:Uncharacterized protein n=1 Tax=Austropuccinia psidii MF-1 TaxID=1389203 RepID=A0A9Q3GJ52_9BASI|nr:hypothetical protein [Austropuccinia psidii MF-1]